MLDNMTYWIENADSALLLPTLPAASVDALVTDPPAGIGFMGKEWDGSKGGRDKWIAWLAGILRECCRVMKPGASTKGRYGVRRSLKGAGFVAGEVLFLSQETQASPNRGLCSSLRRSTGF